MINVTVFGVVWLLIIVFVFIFLKPEQSILCLLFSMLLQSNSVFLFNQTSIGPQIITSSLFLLIFSFKKRINKQLYYKVSLSKESRREQLAFLIFLIYLIINTIILENISMYLALNILMITIYYLTYIKLRKIRLKAFSIEKLEEMLNKILVVILFVGFLQMLSEYGFISRDGFLKTFIYSDIYSSVVFNDRIIKRFYSTFMEPSFASAYLVSMWFFIYFSKKNKPILLTVLSLSIILTKSTTGYITFVVMLFFLILNKKLRVINKFWIIYLFLLLGVCLYILRFDLIANVLLYKVNTSSYATRNNWNRLAIEIYKNNPLFGIGFKNMRASSLFLTILGELGTVGFLLYFNWIIRLLSRSRRSSTSVFYLVLSILVNQFIASPDLSLSVFWFSVYVFGLYENVRYNQEAKRKIN